MQSQKLRLGRREFLKRSAGGMVSASTLSLLASHAVWAQGHNQGVNPNANVSRGYGPPAPTPDQNGDAILALPAGFSYVTFSKTGAALASGGGNVARNHDGMTALAGPEGTVRLIRNHEVRNTPGNFAFGIVGPTGTRYDPLGAGGTISVDYDPVAKRPVREFISLNGTIVNCSGGLAYRDAGWITCEETTAGPNQGWARKHGYNFLVPAHALGTALAVPLTAMGRFAHEASVADPRTGIVYQTEDSGNNSGFYRFLPNDPEDLTQGGRLQMVKVSDQPLFTGWTGQKVGALLMCEWVDIANPDPNLEAIPLPEASCFQQGRAQDGAAFNRLEGIFRGEGGSMYFISTSGGEAQCGQLWQFRPAGPDKGTLTLVFESPSGSVLDSPDNLCVTPSGAVLFCEDDANPTAGHRNDADPLAPGITDVNRLIGLSRDGVPFPFAVNRLNDSEFAGACFSPDGSILFANVFGEGVNDSGMTCAITGPWRKGPL
jgi:secreted PhoX family phosphatase